MHVGLRETDLGLSRTIAEEAHLRISEGDAESARGLPMATLGKNGKNAL